MNDQIELYALCGENIAYHVPLGAFVYKADGRWQIDSPLKADGARRFLKRFGVSKDEATAFIKSEMYQEVYGLDNVPHEGTFVERGGLTYLNLWVPPTIEPVQGDWPRIEQVLQHLCDHDDEAVEHLVNWLAYKIQNPRAIPRTAIVFGTTQGGGKGTLFKVLSEILGPENCVEVGQGALESRFNGHWAGKLLVLGNEVVDGDNVRAQSERLKILIDSPHIEIERKGKDAYPIQNVTGWMFATNATTGGVRLEEGDRRFNVFTNFAPLPEGYQSMVMELFGPGGRGWSEAGRAEVAAFYYSLLEMPVNEDAVGRPLKNAAREALMDANILFHDLFKKDVSEQGIDPFLRDLMDKGNYQLSRTKSEWDFGSEGVSIDVIYEAYVHYTRSRQGHPLKLPKFKAAVEVSYPKWEKVRLNVPGTNGAKKTRCYVVRREAK